MSKFGQMVLAAAVGVWAVGGTVRAATIDGTLGVGEYGSAAVLQTNVSNSNGTSQAGNSGSYDPGSDYVQLSNAFGSIDTSTPGSPKLNLFFGGSLRNNSGDAYLEILIQTHSGGSTNLNAFGGGQIPNSSWSKMAFDAGFAPNAIISFANNTVARTYYNINSGANTDTTPAITYALNNALEDVRVGGGGVGDPGFAGASTGAEMSISLSELGYTGGDIKILALISEASHGGLSNQILSPFAYTSPDPYDYFYIDNTNHVPGNTAGRQFNSAAYPGDQFFTITAAAVPEPASVGLLAIGGLATLRRRRCM